jgi:tRNA A37 N6-isopentenylltransferase MiaA
MTAKPTYEEMQEIPHHLVDIIPVERLDFTVREYQQLGLQAINDI